MAFFDRYVFGFLLLLVPADAVRAGDVEGAAKIEAWNQRLRGANFFMYETGLDEDLKAARDYGMTLLRVFVSGTIEKIPDGYFGSEAFSENLKLLARRINRAHAFGLKVVLTGGRVPGRQYLWEQDGRVDRRLWRDIVWQKRFAAYWRKIAERFASHPAVIGYDILNEPRQEQTAPRDRWTRADLEAFYREAEGTTRDLNALYARTIRAVRQVDSETPIILSSGLWGEPMAFCGLKPVADDDKIIYTFHWYSPDRYTVWRTHKGKWTYPGEMPDDGYDEDKAPLVNWNIDTHRKRMAEPIRKWQQRYGIPSSRIYLGEFSADRRLAGADAYNRDVIRVAEENGWHWTYYSFRERNWNSRDFELGSRRQPTTERSLTPMMRSFVDIMKR